MTASARLVRGGLGLEHRDEPPAEQHERGEHVADLRLARAQDAAAVAPQLGRERQRAHRAEEAGGRLARERVDAAHEVERRADELAHLLGEAGAGASASPPRERAHARTRGVTRRVRGGSRASGARPT